MYSIFKTFVLSALMIAQVHFAYAQNAAILPPAKTTFLDANGKPLTSGTVDFYIPGTSTRKTTWQDQAATIANTNPVTLDAAGRALILGNGAYRQVVKDRLGNPIWDQVTNSAGAGGSGSSTVGDGLSVGTILPWSGLVAPVNYAFPYGQELSRTTYASLFSATTLTQNITCVSGNATITTVSDTTQLNVGAAVEAACLPANSVIVSKTSSTVTLNNLASVSTTTSGVFFPWGNGNGVTTFNAPDLRGVVLPGRNNMGGSNSVNLSSPYYTDPNSLAGRGGSQSHTLIASEMPSHNHGADVTDPGHFHQAKVNTTGGGSDSVGQGATGGSIVGTGAGPIITNTTGITVTTRAAGGGIAASATVGAAGSGYTPGTQLLTVTGGTCTTQPQFNVTISAGAITAPSLVTAGQCTTTPANPAATSGGGGTGGTLNIIYTAVPISIVQPSKTINYILKISPDISLSIANCGNLVDAGTACTRNIGTSGATVPLLNGNNTWSGTNAFSNVAIASGTITGMPLPTLSSDVANKQYVDSVASGLNVLAQTKYATAAVLPNTPTYGNGASGVGATLTAGANSTLTVDGSVVALNEVVLVKNQASAFQNGIYTLTQVGSGAAPWILTRATYFDQAAEMKAGSYTFVTNGSTNSGTSYVLQIAVTTVGTDPLNWVLFTSSLAGVSQLDGVQGVITAQPGSVKVVGSQLSTNVLSSRTFAATQNLSAFSSIKTLGYAAAGDGGEATFQKVSGATAFIDSFVSTFSIQGGSGCTNGGFTGLFQKSGNPAYVVGPVTVAGGAITTVDISHTPGNGYTPGDVLTLFGLVQNGTFQSIACSVVPTITVTGITSPLGSFTDVAANRWQIVNSPFPNVLQFGCKGDWNGTDAGTTDNFTCMQSAAWFAGYRRTSTNFDAGGSWGGYLYVPPGSYKMCGSTYFVLPAQVVMDGGQASGQATLHVCDTFNASLNAFSICDPTWQFSCLGTQFRNISFHASRNVAVSGGIFMVYSNNLQDFGGLYNVYVYGGQRGCFHIEKGYGGSSWVGAERVSCNSGSPNNPMIRIGNTAASGMNFGSTIVSIKDIIIGGPSSAPFQLQSGIQVYGGLTNIENVHCENILNECIYLESPASGNPIQMRFTNINSQGCTSTLTGSGTCSGVITLASTNDPGNVVMSQIISATGPYLHTINNGQPGGVSWNPGVRGQLMCVAGACAAAVP